MEFKIRLIVTELKFNRDNVTIDRELISIEENHI